MNNNVFELINKTNEQVIIKVNADDPLTVAQYPYLSSNIAYITVTRGRSHTLTTVLKKGKTGVSFDWGEHGYTLISDSLERMKDEVMKFLNDKVVMDAKSDEFTKATIVCNDWLDSWQLDLEYYDTFSRYDKTAFVYICPSSVKSLGVVMEKADELLRNFHIIKANEWQHQIAQTGIDIWEADLV